MGDLPWSRMLAAPWQRQEAGGVRETQGHPETWTAGRGRRRRGGRPSKGSLVLLDPHVAPPWPLSTELADGPPHPPLTPPWQDLELSTPPGRVASPWRQDRGQSLLPAPGAILRTPAALPSPRPPSPNASEPVFALEKELIDGPLPGATGQCSLPARSTPGQSGADGNVVFVPVSVPRVGLQQVPAKCLLVRSINSQARIPLAPAGPAGPMHAVACVYVFVHGRALVCVST